MRTTLNIDDDMLGVVRSVARQKNESIGKTISRLLREPLAPPANLPAVRNGVPSLRPEPGCTLATLELVNRIRDGLREGEDGSS